VIVSRRPSAVANERFLQIALEQAPVGSACFVHGALANTLERAREFLALARSRQIALLAGTPLCVTWRLPEVDLPLGTPLAEALIVVQLGAEATQASPPAPSATLGGAELHALEGCCRHRAAARRRIGVRAVRFVEGKDLWHAGDKGVWSWRFCLGLSRSHSPQGDALLDGRTQDLVGLGLVPKLARNPRGWLLEHRDGLRSASLSLTASLPISISLPARRMAPLCPHNFSARHHQQSTTTARLAAAIEDIFFQTGSNLRGLPVERNLLYCWPAGNLPANHFEAVLTQRIESKRRRLDISLLGEKAPFCNLCGKWHFSPSAKYRGVGVPIRIKIGQQIKDLRILTGHVDDPRRHVPKI
jgi:hypothetical protein